MGYVLFLLQIFVGYLYADSPPEHTCLLYTDDPEVLLASKRIFELKKMTSDADTNLGQLCSVGAIGAQTFTGAGHCFKEKNLSRNLYVRCPGKPAFLVNKADVVLHANQDIAVIKSTTPLHFDATLQLPRSKEEVADLLKENNCFIAGYPESKWGKLAVFKVDTSVNPPQFLSEKDFTLALGTAVIKKLNEEMDIIVGKVTSTHYKGDFLREALKGKDGFIDSSELMVFIGRHNAEPGDSGGSFYCVKEGKSYLLGVHTNATNEPGNHWMAISNVLLHRDWIFRNTSGSSSLNSSDVEEKRKISR